MAPFNFGSQLQGAGQENAQNTEAPSAPSDVNSFVAMSSAVPVRFAFTAFNNSPPAPSVATFGEPFQSLQKEKAAVVAQMPTASVDESVVSSKAPGRAKPPFVFAASSGVKPSVCYTCASVS